jgi:hypothetical protein
VQLLTLDKVNISKSRLKQMTTTKAERAVITLGDIELDVFQKPDGTYFMSSSQVAESIDMSEQSFRSKYMAKDLKAILEAIPHTVVFGEKLSVGANHVKANVIPLAVVSLIFGHYASKGNTKASALLMASLTEALERRADAAFGIQKAEEERNKWFAQRVNSKLYRRPFTDKLADENARNGNKTNYGLATLRVYKRAGLSERYKAWKCLPDDKLGFRDTLTTEELANVIRVEDMITNFMHLKRLTFDDAMELYKQLFQQ